MALRVNLTAKQTQLNKIVKPLIRQKNITRMNYRETDKNNIKNVKMKIRE